MSNKDLRRAPHRFKNAEWTWWYESPAGIEVLVEHRDERGRYIKTTTTTIRWASLRGALARKDKP